MPKQIPPLTSAQVMNAKPIGGKRVELRDGMVPGLQLRISPAGERTWSLLVQKASGEGKERLEVGKGLTLSDARAKAVEMRAQVRRGEAPPQPRRDAIAAAKAAKSFGQVIDDYGAAAGGENKTWSPQRSLMRYVFAGLIAKPALELTEADFLLAADKHASKASASNAIRYVRPLIKWSEKRRLMQKGTSAEIETTQTRKRKRVLDNDELERVLGALGDADQDRCARFLLLTLARREEAVLATWRHIDIERAEWTIPAEHRKNTKGDDSIRALIVPLSRQALALVCASDRREGMIFQNADGGRMGNWARWQARVFTASDTTGWHRHDLRRTGATLCGNLGVPPHVIEVLLGHAQPHSDLAGVYNQSRYQAEHRDALQKLADTLDSVELGRQRVVEFRTRA